MYSAAIKWFPRQVDCRLREVRACESASGDPNTLKVLKEGFEKFNRKPYVDRNRLGISGFSRGGMAASLLVGQLDDVDAAVLGAGIYDFKKAHDEGLCL